MPPAPGTSYRHYKGKMYAFVCMARHSETQEEMVVYRALYGDGAVWVRPRSLFFGTVTVNGIPQPRFAETADG